MVGGFVTWAIATYVTDEVLTVAEVFTAATVFTAVFAAVGGILLFTSESQHGTLGAGANRPACPGGHRSGEDRGRRGYGAFLGAVGLAAGYAGA